MSECNDMIRPASSRACVVSARLRRRRLHAPSGRIRAPAVRVRVQPGVKGNQRPPDHSGGHAADRVSPECVEPVSDDADVSHVQADCLHVHHVHNGPPLVAHLSTALHLHVHACSTVTVTFIDVVNVNVFATR